MGANSHSFFGASFAGEAYIFSRSGTSWSQEAQLIASDWGTFGNFGTSVALSGDTAVIGTAGYTAFGQDAGAAYIFVRSGTTWIQQAKLTASDPSPNDRFGISVSMSGETVVVGAYGDDLGVGTTQEGSAYVFVRNGLSWSQQAKLTATVPTAAGYFGCSVNILGNTVVVGACGSGSGLSGSGGGAAYFFERLGSNWTGSGKITASDAAFADQFGYSISMSKDVVVVGAPFDDHTVGFNQGSGYAFALEKSPWTNLGGGLAGVAGIPTLTGGGTLDVGTPGLLALSSSAPTALSILFASLSSAPVPFACGTLIPFPVVFYPTFFTDGSGKVAIPWTAWPAGLSGSALYLQYGVQDAAAPCSAALSNALRADVP